jgi:hypothetical protein
MDKKLVFLIGILILTSAFIGWKFQKSNLRTENSFTEAKNLSNVKVAVWYQRLTDKMQNDIGRDVEGVIEILRETKTDLIFRAWWRWAPCPENCEQLSQQQREICERVAYSYKHLGNAISRIKEELPEIIIIGSVPAQKIDKDLWNPVSGERIGYPDTLDIWGKTRIVRIMTQKKLQLMSLT